MTSPDGDRIARPIPQLFATIATIVVLAALAIPAPAAGAGNELPDYAEYQRLLDDYLMVISAPGEPIETRFDYVALDRRSDKDARFHFIRKGLFQVAPSAMSDGERRAWAINAYNYLVIEAVTNNLWDRWLRRIAADKRFHYRNRQKSVQYIKILGIPFFEAPLVEIEGQKYSLNRFERHFLFFDYDSTTHQPPPAGLDPRVHFALVCAANGCPPLMPRVYRADSLDRQLDRAVRNYLSDPAAGLKWDPAADRLSVSDIFRWYAGDFGGRERAFEFIKRYAPRKIATDPEVQKRRLWSAYVRWDWNLNQTMKPEGEESQERNR